MTLTVLPSYTINLFLPLDRSCYRSKINRIWVLRYSWETQILYLLDRSCNIFLYLPFALSAAGTTPLMNHFVWFLILSRITPHPRFRVQSHLDLEFLFGSDFDFRTWCWFRFAMTPTNSFSILLVKFGLGFCFDMGILIWVSIWIGFWVSFCSYS